MRIPVLSAALLLALCSTTPSFAQTTSPPLALSERPGGDVVEGIVSDGAGGIWITGQTSGGIVASSDALSAGHPGSSDAFVMHIAADGRLLYATYLGGTGADGAHAIARDVAGNLYVAGSTTSPDFPTTPGSLKPQAADRELDAFVVKLDPTGRHILYSTYLGGAEGDAAYGVAVDATGSAAVVGMTQGFGFPSTWSRCISYSTSQQSSFYTRLSPDGSAALFSGCLDDSWANGVTLDANGDAFVVGYAYRQFGPRMGHEIGTFPADADVRGFLAKFTIGASNPLPFSMFIGGDGSDVATGGVAVTTKGIYVTGTGYSVNYPGAPARHPHPKTVTLEDGRTVEIQDGTGWIMKVSLDGNLVLGTTLIDGEGTDDSALALKVDALEVVHATGSTDSSNLAVSAGAAQPSWGGSVDAWYAQAWMPNNVAGDPSYLTYLGGSAIDRGRTLALDGHGGVWIAGESNSSNFPNVNAQTSSTMQAYVARFGQPAAPPPPPPAPAAGDVVIYAASATTTAGNWYRVDDATAGGGVRLWNPDGAVPKIGTPAADPSSYFEVTFDAQAGVPYHLWVRMKADNDFYQNDSIHAQFSDSVNASGAPVWRIGSTSATMVSLEDCSGCGEHGWGWNDNGYDAPATRVVFATSGSHTLRIQQREDGVSIDQIVLSSGTWIDTAPGASRDDTTILPPPPAPPSNNPDEIVLYPGVDITQPGPRWTIVSDETAAGGKRLFMPNLSQPRPGSPLEAGDDYVELQFEAKAGVAYHLWVRAQAQADYWGNDSVYVQFSGSVDAGGAPTFRIGTASATNVILEDCIGCGEAGWGWQDNAYAAFAAPIYFATSGLQTIRLTRREDGISIDQIVLSSSTYFTSPPGPLKNDPTIVPR